MNFLSPANLGQLLDRLQRDYSVYIPVRRAGKRYYSRFASDVLAQRPESKDGQAVVGEVRAVEPLKAFYFQARRKVAEGFRDELPRDGTKPFCVVGAKACDLKSFLVLDTVFGGQDYQDPFYLQARKENLIISADCTCALDVCFCLSLHGTPYPRENYDLNLAEVDGGYLAEAGSDKGLNLVNAHASLFSSSTEAQIAAREQLRARVTEEVRNNIRQNNIPVQELLEGAIKKAYNAPLWQEQAQACVECGACNVICPTCHCFLLYDQMYAEQLLRFRIWDSCLLKDFAKVAGGANPRPQLWMRLRNRFEKKFDFFPQLNGVYACTGCGRCIQACPARIDIREVLRRNVEYVQKQ